MSWEWPKTDRAGLARYVLSDASQSFDLGIVRNDLPPGAAGRQQLVDAIYFSLQDKGLRYALEKYHPADAVQLIRSPSEILGQGQKEGTCLDLALLFCGVCLGNELLPLIVLIEGHAFAAVSLKYDLRTKDALDRSERRYFENGLFTDLNALRQLISSGAYIAVECTGFAQTEKLPATHPEGVGRNFRKMLPFERALSAGKEQLEQADRPFLFALDVAAAQDLGFSEEAEDAKSVVEEAPKLVNVGEGLEVTQGKIKEVVGVKGDASNTNVGVLNDAKLKEVEIDSIVGVVNTNPPEKK